MELLRPIPAANDGRPEAHHLLKIDIWYMQDAIARRFPFAGLNPLRKLSLAVRLGIVSEYIVSKLRRDQVDALPVCTEFQLATMTGRGHLLLLRESLFSFARVASEIPNLIILNDGSIESSEVQQAIRFWPANVEVIGAQSVWSRIEGTERERLKTLAAGHILGLKLAFVLSRASICDTLFVDSDILWFSDPIPCVKATASSSAIAICRESHCSLNWKLADLFVQPAFAAPGPNSGVIWMRKGTDRLALLSDVIEAAATDPSHEFNEQTVFAILASRHGTYFPDSFCLTAFDDHDSLMSLRPWKEGYYARHYVRFMRHQLFRDVLRS